jgi:hypothetical protein
VTDMFVHRTPAAYVTADDLPTVRDYISEIVEIPSLLGWWSFLPSQVTTVSGDVSAIANRKEGAPSLTQGTANRRGAIVTSSDLLRPVLDFPNDGTSAYYETSGLGFNSAAAWTMVALFKPDDYNVRAVCGMVGSAPDFAAIYLTITSSDLIVCQFGDQNAQQTPATAGWQAVIGAGLPGAPAKLEVNGTYSEGGASPSGTPTTDTFTVGSSAFNYFGEMAEIGLFQADLFGSGNESSLALVSEFINRVRTAGA